MLKILNILTVAPSLTLSLLGACLKLFNEGVKPITDETRTNKDNKIQADISNGLNTGIRWVGIIQTLLNKFND